MCKRIATSVASVLACAGIAVIPALTACGQKGPLTLPAATAPAASAASATAR